MWTPFKTWNFDGLFYDPVSRHPTASRKDRVMIFNEDTESTIAHLNSTSLMIAVTYRGLLRWLGKYCTLFSKKVSLLSSNLSPPRGLRSTRPKPTNGSVSLMMGDCQVLFRAEIHLVVKLSKLKQGLYPSSISGSGSSSSVAIFMPTSVWQATIIWPLPRSWCLRKSDSWTLAASPSYSNIVSFELLLKQFSECYATTCKGALFFCLSVNNS